jgi:uncharacterized protein YjbI with pentapeptide repeats
MEQGKATRFEDTTQRIEAVDADLSGSTFTDVNLSNSKFSDMDMAGAKIDNANLTGLIIRNADLRGASIAQSTMKGMTIDGIDVAELFAAYKSSRAQTKARPENSRNSTRPS